MKKRAAFALWLLLWVAVAVGLAEAALRAGVVDLSFQMEGKRFVFDDELLYRNKPAGTEDLDQYGYRFDPAGATPDGRRQIVMTGDSFLFGSNVQSGETMSAYLQKEVGSAYTVLNMGVVGYGPDQSLLLFERLNGVMAADLVVLTIYPPNDFNDLYKNRIFEVDEGGGTIRRREGSILDEYSPLGSRMLLGMSMLPPFAKAEWVEDELFELLFGDWHDVDMLQHIDSDVSRQKIAIMRGVLHRFKERVHALHAAFVVVVIPSSDAFVEPEFFPANGIPVDDRFMLEDVVLELCRAEGITCINLYEYFAALHDATRMFDFRDGHLSPQGNFVTARVILDAARKQGLLPRL